MSDLTPRQQAILAELAAGPRTTSQLAAACGLAPGRGAANYVALAIHRFRSRHGLNIWNLNQPCRRVEAVYEMLDSGRCRRCGCRIASDHLGTSPHCSPCLRAIADAEQELVLAQVTA